MSDYLTKGLGVKFRFEHVIMLCVNIKPGVKGMHSELRNLLTANIRPWLASAIIFPPDTCCVCSRKERERCSQAVFPRLSEEWWRGQAGFCQEMWWWWDVWMLGGGGAVAAISWWLCIERWAAAGGMEGGRWVRGRLSLVCCRGYVSELEVDRGLTKLSEH